MNPMRYLLLMAAAILTLARTSMAAEESGGVRDGVFVHLSHGADDPHRVLMALNMAVIMSEDRDVLVYFDIKAIEVVLKDAADLTYAHFPSSQSQLAKLREKGILLMACPGCLKAAGKTAADLAPGIQIADKNKFFSFTKGRILTLDY
jgi:predicted peroxiredoxin